MGMKLQENKVAMIVALFVGGAHLLWSALVALGYASLVLDFIYGLHFLNNPFTVAPFTLSNAVVLVLVTAAVGYLGGWIFASLWNKVHKK